MSNNKRYHKDDSKKQEIITVELGVTIRRDDEDKLMEIITLEKQ